MNLNIFDDFRTSDINKDNKKKDNKLILVKTV